MGCMGGCLLSAAFCRVQHFPFAGRRAGDRWRFLFRVVVGISDCVRWERHSRGNFVYREPMGGRAMGSAKAFAECDVARFGTSSGARELEDYSPEPIASAFSYQPVELCLWFNANSIRRVHVLGFNGSNTGAVSLRVYRDVGSICDESTKWAYLPANDRVLDMGRCLCYDNTAPGRAGSHCVSSGRAGRWSANQHHRICSS